jgi:hypothetical protein
LFLCIESACKKFLISFGCIIKYINVFWRTYPSIEWRIRKVSIPSWDFSECFDWNNFAKPRLSSPNCFPNKSPDPTLRSLWNFLNLRAESGTRFTSDILEVYNFRLRQSRTCYWGEQYQKRKTDLLGAHFRFQSFPTKSTNEIETSRSDINWHFHALFYALFSFRIRCGVRLFRQFT